jgi:hypothetical protein
MTGVASRTPGTKIASPPKGNLMLPVAAAPRLQKDKLVKPSLLPDSGKPKPPHVAPGTVLTLVANVRSGPRFGISHSFGHIASLGENEQKISTHRPRPAHPYDNATHARTGKKTKEKIVGHANVSAPSADVSHEPYADSEAWHLLWDHSSRSLYVPIWVRQITGNEAEARVLSQVLWFFNEATLIGELNANKSRFPRARGFLWSMGHRSVALRIFRAD